jgi:hypothetical protein
MLKGEVVVKKGGVQERGTKVGTRRRRPAHGFRRRDIGEVRTGSMPNQARRG